MDIVNGVPAHELKCDNRKLVTSYLRVGFDADGACTLLPQNEPTLPIPPRARLLPVHCEERYGLVWVCIGTPRACSSPRIGSMPSSSR